MVTEEEIQAAMVLIVDDQPVNVQLLKMLLREAGFTRVVATTDSREALPLYRKYQPDIVLLDLQMPELDGFGVMAQLRLEEGSRYAPVLILTAETDTEVRRRALLSGARDFLNKPFDPIETRARIRNLLEMRLIYKRTLNHQAHLEEVVQQRTAELRNTQQEIILRLGHAAEYKDNETGNHIVRMSLYCRILGDALGFGPEQLDTLQRAAPMHDVGKIGIPDRILLKPDRLTPEEWEVMKTHTVIGADLLSGSSSPTIQMAQTIAWTHHERWDGSGYPRGLRGDQIPLEGRIVAVCDVFDALTSARPYKLAWSVEDTIAEMQRSKGSHFDPQLVDLFVQRLDEVLAVRSLYQQD